MKKDNIYSALDYNMQLLDDIITFRATAIYKVCEEDELKNVLMRLDDLEKDTKILLSDMHIIIKDYLVEVDQMQKRIRSKYVNMMMSGMKSITRGMLWLKEKYGLTQNEMHLE